MDSKELGKRIKLVRKELDMTQGDIAQAIGVAISTVQRYETGSIERIKLPVVEAIARMLHVDPDWLTGKTQDREPKDVPPVAPEIPEVYLHLLQGAQKMDLDAEDVDFLLDVARRLKQRDDKEK